MMKFSEGCVSPHIKNKKSGIRASINIGYPQLSFSSAKPGKIRQATLL